MAKTFMNILSKENSVLTRFISEMRDMNIQCDSMRFRRNLERCGEVMAYEISKRLSYEHRMVETPLGEAEMQLCNDQIVIASILRAGVPFHNGFLNYFDNAQNAFVSAFRKYSKDGTFNIKVEYVSSCDLTDKTLILVDPMIATGSSVELTYKALVAKSGTPRHTHIATVIASEEGTAYIKKNFRPDTATLWCGAVDEELTVKSFIVPGMGDVGDLAYGDKL